MHTRLAFQRAARPQFRSVPATVCRMAQHRADVYLMTPIPGAAIGRHAVLNTNCSVDHDCQIGDFASVSPGAALAGP
jgi:hypothetical protein